MTRDVIRRFRECRPLTLLCLCFTVGVVIGYQDAAAWWIWAIGLWASILTSLLRRRSIFVFTSGALLGALMVSIALIRPAVAPADDVVLTGRLSDEVSEHDLFICFPITDARMNDAPLPTDVMVYLYGDEYPALEYGASISVRTDLYLPSEPGNPQGFDYSAYLWREGIALCASASADELAVTAPPEFSLKRLSLQCRARIQAVVDDVYPAQTAPLISALLLGDRSMLPDELISQFKVAGVSHILAISGLHISCLAMALDMLLRKMRCPGKVSFVLVTLLLSAYAWMIGFPASVIRAILMFTLSCGARLTGRPSNPLTGLSLALMILLLVNPLSIADVALLLSFASVGGILLLTRLIMDIFPLPRKPLALRDVVRYVFSALAASLAAQLGTLPVVACVYANLTTYSLLANLPVLPLITVTLPVAMLSLGVGFLWPALGRIMAHAVALGLDSLVGFTGWVASLPGALVDTPCWPVWMILLYLLLCMLCASVSGARRWIKRVCLMLMPLLAASALLLPAALPTAGMEVLFLDVGQADAALLRAEQNYYLVDVGEGSTVRDYLADTGIRPSAVFLTHPHTDHVDGLAEIITLCPPTVLYLPCLWNDAEADEGVPEIIEAARQAGWSLQFLQAGDVVPLSEHVRAEVYQPWPGMTTDGNGASLILRTVLGDGSVLFTGDLPADHELAFFPDCDVIKVAHHGAAGSTSNLLLQMTSPSAAIISVGHNSYGHPADETLQRLSGIPTYRTDQCGAISVLVQPDGTVHVTPFKTPTISEAAS